MNVELFITGVLAICLFFVVIGRMEQQQRNRKAIENAQKRWEAFKKELDSK